MATSGVAKYLVILAHGVGLELLHHPALKGAPRRSPRNFTQRATVCLASARTIKWRLASFANLSLRSARVAYWLREQEVQRGDRMIIMLCNQVDLWV